MTVYYVIYAILILTALLAQKRMKKSKLIIVTVGFVLLFLMFALRHWSMGWDLGYALRKKEVGYIPAFREISSMSWKKVIMLDHYINYEKGYIIFNKLVGSIWNNEQFFLGVCAFIGMLPIFMYIYRTSDLPLLSIIVFMTLPAFFMYYSGMRQAIAISITVMSSYFIEKKQKIPFILLVLLAWTFHSSAILFLIAYPMYHLKLTNAQRLMLVVIIPIVFVLRAPLFRLLSVILKEDAEMKETGAGVLMVVFVMIYILLLLLNRCDDEKINGSINLFYIACLCQCFSGVYNTAMRVGYYFMIYLITALPNTVYDMKNREYKAREQYLASYLAMVFIFTIYGLSSIANSTWAGANPYVFFWQK